MNGEIKKKITYTKDFWQSDYEYELTDSDALEIVGSTSVLISFFNDVVKSRKQERERGDAVT